MNIFAYLPQYSGDTIIETSNQLRNSKKKLKRLEEKNGDSEEIKKLNILINEYVNKNNYNKKNTKVNMEKKFDENEFLNNEVRRMNFIKKKLLREKENNKIFWKKNKNNPRKWKYKSNMSYPISFRITIVTIFCINNRPGNVLNLLPKDILIYILENNISWFSFPSVPNEKIIFRNYK
tara:strand:- start:373 stop:906 length:534 start_codon:yes stop_codon:yes gene_type:complete